MSSKEPTEIENVIHLQEILDNLCDENLDESINKIVNSVYLENETNLNELFVETAWMIPIRVNKIHLFAKFLMEIAKAEKIAENPDFDKIFKAQLLDALADKDVPQLIYILYKEYGFFTEKDVNKVNCTKKADMFFDIFNEDSVLWDHPLLQKNKKDEQKINETLTELRENYWLKSSIGYALKNDDCDLIQKMVDEKFDFNQKIEWSEFEVDEPPPSLSLLGISAYYGSYLCFSFIQVSGGKIDEDIAKCAVMGGNIEIITLCKEYIKNCFIYAFRYHHKDVMKWLVDEGEECTVKPIDCILEHNLKYLDKLVSEGSDISTFEVNDSGITPLVLATQHGALDLIQYLINRGASPNASDRNGRTALHFAVKANNLKTIQLLIKNGADVNAQDSKKVTPLMDASIAGNLECVKLLLENNADPTIPDHRGVTPIKRALQNEVKKCLAEAEKKRKSE